MSGEDTQRDRVAELKTERIKLQQKTFTKWMNAFLEKSGSGAENIFIDLADGVLLFKLLEEISGDKIGNALRGKQRIHKIENVSRVLQYLKKSVKIESIGPEDIVDGKEELILGLIWTIILRFSIKDIQDQTGPGKSIKDSLLIWCQNKTKGYTGVDIKNFTTSWRNGLAFNALIHAHRPDLFDYDTLAGRSNLKNLSHAFTLAEEKLGIKKILDPQDIDVMRPEEKSIMAYVVLMYQYFAKAKNEKTSEKRLVKFVSELQRINNMREDYEHNLSEMLAWIKVKSEELKRPLADTPQELKRDIHQFKQFRNNEKPARYSRWVDIEAHFLNLRLLQQANQQKCYQPPNHLLLCNIQKEWSILEVAEHQRDLMIRQELSRHDRINQLLKRFAQKARLRETWLNDKCTLIDNDKSFNEIAQQEVKTHSRRLQGMETDIKAQQIRINKLNQLVEEIKALRYHDVNSLVNRVQKLQSFWSNVSKKITAKKKTLNSLQKVVAVLDDINNLNSDLKQFSLLIRKDPPYTNIMDVEVLLQENQHQLSKLKNKKNQLQDIQGRAQICLREQNLFVGRLKTSLDDAGEHIKALEDELKTMQLKFEGLKMVLKLQDDLQDELIFLKEKQILLSRSSKQAFNQNQNLRHENLLNEVKQSDDRSSKLFERLRNMCKTQTADLAKCEKLSRDLKEELRLVKIAVDKHSIQVTFNSLSHKFESNIKESISWIDEQLDVLNTFSSPGNVDQTIEFQKKLKELSMDVQVFEKEIILFNEQKKDLVDISNNQYMIFLQKVVVKKTYVADGSKICKGEIIYLESVPNSTEPTDIIHNLTKHQLPLRIVDGYPPLRNENEHETLLVSLHGKPFISFGTNSCVNLTSQSNYHNLMKLFDENKEKYQLLKDMLSTLKSDLFVDQSFYETKERFQEFFAIANSSLSYISSFELEDDSHIIERRWNKLNADINKCRNLHENLTWKATDLPGERSHRMKDYTALQQKAAELMYQLSSKHDSLKRNINQTHGCRTLKENYDKLKASISNIRPKFQDDMTSLDSLNAIRAAQKDFQNNKRHLEALKISKEKLIGEFHYLSQTIGEEKQKSDLEFLKDFVENDLRQLDNDSAVYGEELSSLYGVHGFMTDAKELLVELNEHQKLLQNIEISDDLVGVQKNQELLNNLKDEFMVSLENASDLIRLGENLTHPNSKQVYYELEDSYGQTQLLIENKSSTLANKYNELHHQKQFGKTEQKLQNLLSLVEELDFQRDTMGISSGNLAKESEKLTRQLSVEERWLRNNGGDCPTHIQVMIDKAKRKLRDIEDSIVEMVTFEQFMRESESVLESIKGEQDKLENIDGVDSHNLERRVKDLDSIKTSIGSLQVAKEKLDEKGSFFLEECHFASVQIADQMETSDGAWQALMNLLQVKEKKIDTFSKQNELINECSELSESLGRIDKKLSSSPDIASLSFAKKCLGDVEQLQNELNLHQTKVDRLLEKCKHCHDSIPQRKLDLCQKLKTIQEKCRNVKFDRCNEVNFQSFQLHALMEISWLDEKENLLQNLAQPLTITEALSISKSLKMLQDQIQAHQSCLKNVVTAGESCLNNDPVHQETVQNQLRLIQEKSESLNIILTDKMISNDRQNDIFEALLMSDNHLEFIDNKLSTVMSNEYGTDLNSSDNAVKKHCKIKTDISNFKRKLKPFIRDLNNLASNVSSAEVKTFAKGQPDSNNTERESEKLNLKELANLPAEFGSTVMKQSAQIIKSKFKKLEQCSLYREKMLQDSNQLFALYSEADQVKTTILEIGKQIPSDEQNALTYDQANANNERIQFVKHKLQAAKVTYDKFSESCKAFEQHPHHANITKVKNKVEIMYQKLGAKIESRSKKSNKLLMYHDFTNSLGNINERLNEIQNSMKRSQRNLAKLESLSALREEVRRIGHVINDTRSLKEGINKLAEKLSILATEYPGKSIKTFEQHVNALKSRYTECSKQLKILQVGLQIKIGRLTFNSDVQYLDGWLESTRAELNHLLDTAVDYSSTCLSIGDLEMKSKEIALKKRMVDDLRRMVQDSKDQNENDKMKKQLLKLSKKHEEIEDLSKQTSKVLKQKLDDLKLYRDLNAIGNGLSSLQERVMLLGEKSNSQSHGSVLRKLDEYSNILSSERMRTKQIKSSNDKGDSDVLENLEILDSKMNHIGELISKQRSNIHARINLDKFQSLFGEVKEWLETTKNSLEDSSAIKNIKIATRGFCLIKSQKVVTLAQYEELQTLRNYLLENKHALYLENDMETDKESPIASLDDLEELWKQLEKLTEKRASDIEEQKLLLGFEQTSVLITSHLEDQISIVKNCGNEEDKTINSNDGVQFKLTTMESVKININKYSKQIEEFKTDVSKYLHLNNELNPLVDSLEVRLGEAHRLHEETVKQLRQTELKGNFHLLHEELKEKTRTLDVRLNATPVCTDERSICRLQKAQLSFQSEIVSLKTRTDDLRLIAGQLEMDEGHLARDNQLVGLDQDILELNEKVKRMKLTLEAQSKLHSFFEETKKFLKWVEKVTSKIERLSQETTFDLESRLRSLSDFQLQLSNKRENMLALSERGQTLVQDGQLSSMEVESRLGEIKTGLQRFEQLLKITEESSYKNISFNKLKQKFSSTMTWLQEQTNFLQSLKLDDVQSFEEVQDVKRNLKMLQSRAGKHQDMTNDLTRMFQNLSTVDLQKAGFELDELKERFELLKFELDEKLHEVENAEEMFKLFTKYCTLTDWINKKTEKLMDISNQLNLKHRDIVISMEQELDAKESLVNTILKGVEEHRHHALFSEQNLRIRPIQNREGFQHLKSSVKDLLSRLSSMTNEKSLVDDLKILEDAIEITTQRLRKITFCTSDIEMSKAERDGMEIKGLLSSYDEQWTELLERANDMLLPEELNSKIEELTRKLSAIRVDITTKERELIQKNIQYLTLHKRMETEELWFNSKQTFIKSHIPSDYNNLVKWEEEFIGIKQEFHCKRQQTITLIETVKNLLQSIDSKDSAEFHQHIAINVGSFQRRFENFEDEVKSSEKVLGELLRVNQIILRLDDVHSRYEELCEKAQDISTGQDLQAAQVMLQKHEFNKSQHESYDSRFAELKMEYLEVKECSCLGAYEELLNSITEKFNDLQILKSEVHSLMKNRSKTLKTTFQFFQFRSELSFLDAWIQSQIDDIKTDGIGNTTAECEHLIRETESFARNLMAREERVAQFGVLSQDMVNSHPLSAKQIMKNTSNIYELWNDVKDLLQTRLETLDQGLHSHRFRDKILVLNQWTNEIQAKFTNIKIQNGSEETRQILEDMKGQHGTILSKLEIMESEKERLRLNIEACEVLVAHSMETLAQDLRKLKMLIDSKENLLNEVMDFHDFKKQLSDLESWMERTSKRTQAYMNDVTETVSRKHVHGELSSEIESRRQYVMELHLKKQNDFHCFTKDNLDVLTNCWCSFERKWHALQSQVRMLGDLVENTDGLNHILNDFDAIESWLDEQEKKIYLEPSNKLNDSLDESGFENGFLENALSNQNELEEFLKIQDEKVRSTCDKIDSFKMVKTGDNDSTDMTCSSEVQIIEKALQLENQVEDTPSNGGLDDSEPSNHSNEINNNETTGTDSLRDIPQTSPSKPDKVLIGLLKKSRTPSNSKKRVVFSTTHEFSDCVTIQQFSKLNDEYEQEQHYFYEDDDDDYDNYADGNYANYVDDDHWEDDGIVFSEEALSPSYYPEPPEEFLHLSDSDEDEDDDDDCWAKDYFIASTTTSPRDEEVESPNIFDFPTSPNKANDDDEQEQQSNENSSSSNQLTFLNYEEEVESDVYFTDSEDEGDVLP